MEIVKGAYYGVVTGDIVNSSKLPAGERQRLFSVMRSGAAELRQFFGDRIPMDVDIFRGDSWQFVLARPSDALRAGLLYRAYIKAHMLPAKLDSRLVIAIGTIDFIVDRISESDGEVFRLSGKTLESLSNSVYMRLIAPHMDNADEMDAQTGARRVRRTAGKETGKDFHFVGKDNLTVGNCGSSEFSRMAKRQQGD